jgi:hypothetical protein
MSREQILETAPPQGTDADDILTGSHVDDVLAGGAGNDQLLGRDGNDVLIGGPGDDTLNSGAGSDTYEWSVGDGNDLINDKGGCYDGTDTLRLKGVEASDLSIERLTAATTDFPYDSLRITVKSTGETITVTSQYLVDAMAGDFLAQYSGNQDNWGDNVIFADGGPSPLQGTFNLTDISRGIEQIILDDGTVINPFDPSAIRYAIDG